MRSYLPTPEYISPLWVFGGLVLSIATWVSFHLGLSSATAACVYLAVIVLLSLTDNFLPALIFPVVAVGCLDFFFIQPIFALEVDNPQDIITLLAFLLTSIVITTLVRRLRRLGQAHHEQVRLLDLTSDAILVRDLDNLVTYWNRGCEELYGWSSEEAIGKSAHQLLQTVLPAPLERIANELLSGGHWEGELLHRKRDGTPVTVTSRWSMQLRDDGQPIGILEISSDITSRRRMEDALRGIQDTYIAEAQQLSHTGSFGWKITNGEIFLSEEGFKIFGIDPKTRPSIDSLLARVHPDDRAFVEEAVDGAEADRGDFSTEHRLRLPDGTIRHVRIVARAMRNQTASVDFVGAVMDVTSIRLAELELRNARAELAHVTRVMSLGELTASIAHEVNQPLGAVVANAAACLSWLDRDSPDLGEARAAIERIVRDGHRAGEVIRRVRALVKGTDTQLVPLDIREVVNEVIDIAEQELLSSQVSQRVEAPSELPLIVGDRVQLQQVLLNLIINGIEAMQPVTDRQRELVIRIEQSDPQHLQVTVLDSGIGLSVENRHRIFEALVTTKASGMGMGLSICRSIVQAHGGKIWASSDAPCGAAIRFTLPLHEATGAS